MIPLLLLLWNCSALSFMQSFISQACLTNSALSPSSPSFTATQPETVRKFSLPLVSFPLSKVGLLSFSLNSPSCLPRQSHPCQPDHVPHSQSTCWFLLTVPQQDPTLQPYCAGLSVKPFLFTVCTSLSISYSPYPQMCQLILPLPAHFCPLLISYFPDSLSPCHSKEYISVPLRQSTFGFYLKCFL